MSTMPRRQGRSRVRGRRMPRSRALLLGLFLLLLLLVLNASALLTYRQVRGTIEDELAGRLLGIASATAAGIPGEMMRSLRLDPEGATAQRLRTRLAQVRFETELGDLYLVDPGRRHLLDVDGRYALGDEHPGVELHYAAATAAVAGVPAASELYEVGGVYLITAFAPIFDETGEVLGALAAEGGGSFFAGLWSLRRQVMLTGAAGMLVVLILAVFFSRLLRTQAMAERTLRETSALAAAGELAAVLAHEIRNPLAIISSRAERVRAKIEKGRPAEEVLSWFDVIPREVEQLDQILAQYLSYARPLDLAVESAAIEPTLSAVLGLLENDLARRGIRLRRAGEAQHAPRVQMAPAALHQVLLNLLLNARDAMPAGGELAVAVRASRHWVAVEVADTGEGMTPEEQRRVFEAFYTTKPGGSGLGLAVVRSMLDLYGARANIESAPGGGTTFTVEIPIASGGDPAPREDQAQRRREP